MTDLVRSSDDVERDDLVSDEPAVHAPAAMPPTCSAGRPAAHDEDAGDGDDDSGDDLQHDGVGGGERHDGRGEAADRGERASERDVVELDSQEDHSRSNPGDGHSAPLSPLTRWRAPRSSVALVVTVGARRTSWVRLESGDEDVAGRYRGFFDLLGAVAAAEELQRSLGSARRNSPPSSRARGGCYQS